MKRTFSLWLRLAAAGFLALALTPVHADQAGKTGKIHGKVINPTGQPQSGGSVSLSNDGGLSLKYTFKVDDTGSYSGEAPAGTYMVIYRQDNTPAGQMVDSVRGVKIEAGQDTEQNIDMSRQEYIDKLPPDEKKQLEELKQKNAAALSANKLIAQLNADLKTVAEDRADIENATDTATKSLGKGASKADVDSKAEEIKTAKFNDIVSLMTKDTSLKADEPLLWVQLGYGQAGLKKYDDAITSYKKAVDLESASTNKKPRPSILGQADSGLGEIYARTGKVPEANAAFDAAAKADPTNAQLYLRNQAVIFFQENNAAAQTAAADIAIKADPNPNDPGLALMYYLKAQGLIMNATVDASGHYVLPPECSAAYHKYLELAPNGQFAQDVEGILQQAGEKVTTSYKASKK